MGVVGWLNQAAGSAVDLLTWPVRALPAVYGLMAISAVSAAFVLLAFRFTSNQDAIAASKRQLQAQLLRIVLYRHDLNVMLRAERDLLRANLSYMLHGLVPLVIVIGPMVLLFAQLDARYGHEPLGVGEPAILSVHVRRVDDATRAWHLEAPPSVEVETPALRVPTERQVDWRVRPTKPGRYVLEARTQEAAFGKSITVSDHTTAPLSRRRTAGLASLLYPPEPPLPAAGPVVAIDVGYASQDVTIGPLRVHWAVAFLAATLVFALVLRRPLRVQV